MSRFFQAQTAVDDSDYSSSEEESLYGSSSSILSESSDSSLSDSGSDSEASVHDKDAHSDSDNDSDSDADDRPRNQFLRSQFLKGQGSDSDDSDDEKVVVKSAKDKLLDEINEGSDKIISNSNQKVWSEALTIFEKIVKSADKFSRQYESVPKQFVKMLAHLNNELNNGGKDTEKKLQLKSKNQLKLRLKKVSREYSARLEAYIADPENYDVPGAAAGGSKPASVSNVVGAGKKEAEEPETAELSSHTVFQTLLSVMETRGRKNADKSEQVSLLDSQLALAETNYEKICLLLMLISLRFDLASTHSNQRTVSSGPEFHLWEQIEHDLRNLFDVLESQDEYLVVESAPELEDIVKGPELVNNKRLIPGSMPTLVERLDDEHAKIMMNFDPHTTEYMERLGDETRLGELILRGQCYAEHALGLVNLELQNSEPFCRLLSRRVEHIYYKPASVVAATDYAAWQKLPSHLNSLVTPRPEDQNSIDPITLIGDLCKVLYAQSNIALRTKAILSLIYQFALGDDYYKARDLMLMSHLQSQVHNADPATQVLFNRALVQVGLCAFRAGLVAEAQQSLQEICGTSRLKELLGQAAARPNIESTPTQTTQLQQQQPDLLPYHMHINLELVECVYLTVSMLIEIPFLAGNRNNSTDLKKRPFNRPFRRLLDMNARQVFNGPSETTRDCVIQAAKHLQMGDWRACFDVLKSVKVWGLISAVADVRAKVSSMLEHKIKIAGLQTYLLSFCITAYKSLSLEVLAKDFDLSLQEVEQLLVKMISADEVPALLDESSKFLIFKQDADTPKVESVALNIAEKAWLVVERNERINSELAVFNK